LVAKTISTGLNRNDDFFSGNLIHAFRDVVEKKKELISDEAFIQIIKKLTGHVWDDDNSFSKASYDFYTFAKRFTLIDLPLVVSTKSVSRALVSFAQDFS